MTFTGFKIFALWSKLCTAMNARFQVRTEVLPKIQFFLDVTLLILVNSYCCFDGLLWSRPQESIHPRSTHDTFADSHSVYADCTIRRTNPLTCVNNLFAAAATLSSPISFRQTTIRTYLCTYVTILCTNTSVNVAAAVAANEAST
jgi:hypothetical protein